MEQNFSLTPVHTDKQIQEISNLASVIWHEQLHSHYRHTAGRIYAGKISVFSCPERTDGNRI